MGLLSYKLPAMSGGYAALAERMGNVAVVAILYSFISNDSITTVPTDEVLRS